MKFTTTIHLSFDAPSRPDAEERLKQITRTVQAVGEGAIILPKPYPTAFDVEFPLPEARLVPSSK